MEDAQRVLGANVQDPVCRDIRVLQKKVRGFLNKSEDAMACGIEQTDLDELATILDDPEIKSVCG
ncbi:MAG: hypothetical protein HC779_06235 [Phyllobacteriaceae bacterium]|nr:hypothetical protein [Phyllobacteriaceae bacterium]